MPWENVYVPNDPQNAEKVEAILARYDTADDIEGLRARVADLERRLVEVGP
jgi:hypothetical protein